MNEFSKLKNSTDNALVRELLTSASEDRSSHGARERALAVLGLGASVAATSAVATSAKLSHAAISSAKVAGSSVAPSALAQKGLSLIIVKWLGIGLLSGGALTSVASYAYQRITNQPTTSRVSNQRRQPATKHKPQTVAEREELRKHSSQADSSSEALTIAPSTRAVPSGSPALRHQRQASSTVDSAVVQDGNSAAFPDLNADSAQPSASKSPAPPVPGQTTTSDGNPHVAADVDESIAVLEHRYQRSPLHTEMAVLRIEALALAGRTREAQDLASAFFNSNPGSVYAKRIRSSLGLR